MAPRKTPKRPARKAKRAEVAATDKQRLHRHVMNAAYLDKPAHLRTRAERSEAGKALRVVCPRESHAGFQPAADRPDPIDLLVQSSEGRIEHLVPIRYGRMLASPFAFFRGAAAIMAADLSQTPCTGIGVQACGDAHLANFGAFATPERRIVFDINDFDETYPAPWEWDLKRLAASFVIASRHNGHKPADGRAAAAAVVEHYRDRMRELAEMPTLSAWYSYLDYEKMIESTEDEELKRRRRKVLDKALQRDSAAEFVNLAHIDGGQPRIRDMPPLIYHSDEQKDPAFAERLRENVAALSRVAAARAPCAASTATSWPTWPSRWWAWAAWARCARWRCSSRPRTTRCSCRSRKRAIRCWRPTWTTRASPPTASAWSSASG